MLRNVAFAIVTAGLLGSASLAIAAPAYHQTQVANEVLAQVVAPQPRFHEGCRWDTGQITANPYDGGFTCPSA